MPIYSYKCLDCDEKFEIFQKTISELSDGKCPKCESSDVRKLMSAHSVGKTGSKAQSPPCQTGGDCSSCCGFH